MRLRDIVCAAAAAGAALALSPPGALAEKHPSPGGRCSASINVAPRVIEAGEAALIFGRLVCPGEEASAVGARTVKLWQRVGGARSFHVVASTTTDVRGFYELVRANLEFNSEYYVRSRSAESARKAIRVLAHVTLKGPADGTQLLTGAPNRVTFTGTVSPHDAGAIAVLQRQNAQGVGDDWHRIDAAIVGADGTYSITHAFVMPGDANLRVLVRSQRRNAPTPSDVLTYEISQAQNQQLTIDSSQDPISYGQTTIISGGAPGAPNAPVTLLARTSRQSAFAPVAEVRTDATGNYAFPAQAPVASTFYEVRGAGRLSTVLFQGVRDVLTAAVSATSVQAGQSLTFFGSVSPDHTGHVIYLERQDRFGDEFHVVQIATVGTGSTYTIVHTVYVPGTKVFRVKIPGGPENGGAASRTFTVQVTPAPAATLKPEAPGNSTLPSEGEI